MHYLYQKQLGLKEAFVMNLNPMLLLENSYVHNHLAFTHAAGAIVPNSKVTLSRVNLNPTRTGIVKVLEQMGAKISIEQVPSKGEELGNLTIEISQLAPVKLTAEDIIAFGGAASGLRGRNQRDPGSRGAQSQGD